MALALLPILIWISLSDLKTHRIPNSSLFVISLVSLLFFDHRVEIWVDRGVVAAIVLFLALGAWRFFGLGMGDVKLLVIAALLILPTEVSSYQIFALTFAIAAIAHLSLATRGQIMRVISLPLGPAISVATSAALFIQ